MPDSERNKCPITSFPPPHVLLIIFTFAVRLSVILSVSLPNRLGELLFLLLALRAFPFVEFPPLETPEPGELRDGDLVAGENTVVFTRGVPSGHMCEIVSDPVSH